MQKEADQAEVKKDKPLRISLSDPAVVQELDGYAAMINRILEEEPTVQHLLPVTAANLMNRISSDGWLMASILSKLPPSGATPTSSSSPKRFKMHKPSAFLNPFQIWENHKIVLQLCAEQQPAVKLGNVGPDDLVHCAEEGHTSIQVVLGMIKQLLQLFATRKVTKHAKHLRGLSASSLEGQVLTQICEALEKFGFTEYKVTKLEDLSDGKALLCLLHHLNSVVVTKENLRQFLQESITNHQRVHFLLSAMEESGLESYARLEDVLNGNKVLLANLASTFLAEISNPTMRKSGYTFVAVSNEEAESEESEAQIKYRKNRPVEIFFRKMVFITTCCCCTQKREYMVDIDMEMN